MLIDRRVRRYSKREFLLQRFFFFSPFFPFCFRKMTRSRSASPGPDVFPIDLFICLFIYFLRLPRLCRHRLRRCRRRRCRRRRLRCHRLRLEKTLHLRRDCLLRSWSIAVKHHRFFLEYYTAILSNFKSDRNFRSSPEVGDACSKSSCRHFSLPCTPHVNVKLRKACAELKITYQLYGLSIRIPIRKVRIAEPL